MTVVLNAAGIERLMISPPVMAFVKRAADQKLVEPLQQSIVDYFHTAPTLTVEGDVDSEIRGPAVVVGIRDTHSQVTPESKGQRLVRSGLIQKWLREAEEEAHI